VCLIIASSVYETSVRRLASICLRGRRRRRRRRRRKVYSKLTQ